MCSYAQSIDSHVIKTNQHLPKSNIVKLQVDILTHDIANDNEVNYGNYWPILAYEKRLAKRWSLVSSFAFKQRLKTATIFKYEEVLAGGKRMDASVGVRYYLRQDSMHTFGKGLYVPMFLSVGYIYEKYRLTTLDIYANYYTIDYSTKTWFPSVSVGLGYQNYITKRVPIELELYLSKGKKNSNNFKTTNYTKVCLLKLGVGYLF